MGNKDKNEETKKVIKKNVHYIVGDVVGETTALQNNFVNRFVYIFGVLGPIITTIQAIKIFVIKSAMGVSLTYWIAYLAVALMWFAYGYTYKDKPIMVSYGLWIIVEIAVLNGIIFYG